MDPHNLHIEIERVKRLIDDTFPDQPIPFEYRRSGGVVNHEVSEDIQKFLGHAWQDIPLSHWVRSVSASSIRRGTSVDFFIYYLPSLLIGVIDDLEWAHIALDALLPDNATLEPRDEWRVFRCQFGPAQAEAVAAFLELLKERVHPEGADWFRADAGLSGLWN